MFKARFGFEACLDSILLIYKQSGFTNDTALFVFTLATDCLKPLG